MAILIGMTGNVFLITVNNFIEAKETRSALSFSWVISINHASLSCELNVSYSNYYIATSLAPVSILKRGTIEWFNVKCRLDKFKILKVFEIQDIWFCYFVNGIVWRKKGVLCNPIRMRQNFNIDVFFLPETWNATFNYLKRNSLMKILFVGVLISRSFLPYNVMFLNW